MPPLLQLQKLPGKGDGKWEKMSLRRFLADKKIASSWKKYVANSLSPPSIVKKVRTGSKSSQGT